MLSKILHNKVLLPVYIVLFIFFAAGLQSCRQAESKHNNTTKALDDKESPIALIKFPEPGFVSKEDSLRIAGECDRWWKTSIANTIFNGGILVAWKGRVLFERYQGSEPLGSDSMTATTPLHIASVTKTFTAMAVLKLAEEGKIKIDDLYSAYFPGFNYDSVRIKSLLSHRSGLPNYLYAMESLNLPTDKFITNQQVYDILVKHKAELKGTEPANRRFVYNNTNYALLALLIEKVTGMSYPEYMQKTIFIPYGLKNTYVYTEYDSSRATKNYDWRGRVEPMTNFDGIYGDKNIYSTPDDLLRWDRALSNNLYLKKETIDPAYIPYSNEKPGVKNYGLGWRMNVLDNGKKFIFHTGWWHGLSLIHI